MPQHCRHTSFAVGSASHHRVYGKSAEAHAGETTVGSATREGGAAVFGWCLPLAQLGTQHCKVYATQGTARPLGRHCLCIGPMGAPRHSGIHRNHLLRRGPAGPGLFCWPVGRFTGDAHKDAT